MPLPLLIPAALGAAQLAAGLIKGKKAGREAERLEASRPKAKASPYLSDALSLAESELSTGMSSDAERAYEEGLSRDTSSSLDAILKGGGDINNVAEIFDKSATGRNRLALMKDNLRLNQINNLVNAQTASENERQQMFQFNEWAPWADRSQANASARQGAENMVWGGLQTIGSAATGFLQGQNTQSQLNSSFNATPPTQIPSRLPQFNTNTVPTGATPNPGANRNYINPNYGSDFIQDALIG